jgi:hypothetical protein
MSEQVFYVGALDDDQQSRHGDAHPVQTVLCWVIAGEAGAKRAPYRGGVLELEANGFRS